VDWFTVTCAYLEVASLTYFVPRAQPQSESGRWMRPLLVDLEVMVVVVVAPPLLPLPPEVWVVVEVVGATTGFG
jgi:hypothetical protein